MPSLAFASAADKHYSLGIFFVQTHNKLVLASEMFVEAHERFTRGTRDIDFVASLMLSGAVVGIVAPLTKEQGRRSMHELLAALSDLVAEPSDELAHEGMFRTVYNGLKHAGNRRSGVAPSKDLMLRTDLRLEAAEMLNAAREDFSKVLVEADVRAQVAPQFVDLITSSFEYA